MKNIEIILTSRCDINCIYCISSYNKNIKEFSSNTVEKILLWGAKNKVEGVYFGGGEPTLVDELSNLIATAKKLNYKNIQLKSNAIKLQDKLYLQKLIESGLNEVEVSVSSYIPKISDSITGVQGAFASQINGIKNIIESGIKLELVVLISTKNYKILPEIINFFSEFKVKNFTFWLVSLFGLETNNLSHLLPRITDVVPYIVESIVLAQKKKLNILSLHIPSCFFEKKYRRYVFNVRELDLLIIDPSGKFKLEDSPFEGGVKTAECSKCRENKNCLGLRKDYIDIFNDTIVLPIPRRDRTPCLSNS